MPPRALSGERNEEDDAILKNNREVEMNGKAVLEKEVSTPEKPQTTTISEDKNGHGEKGEEEEQEDDNSGEGVSEDEPSDSESLLDEEHPYINPCIEPTAAVEPSISDKIIADQRLEPASDSDESSSSDSESDRESRSTTPMQATSNDQPELYEVTDPVSKNSQQWTKETIVSGFIDALKFVIFDSVEHAESGKDTALRVGSISESLRNAIFHQIDHHCRECAFSTFKTLPSSLMSGLRCVTRAVEEALTFLLTKGDKALLGTLAPHIRELADSVTLAISELETDNCLNAVNWISLAFAKGILDGNSIFPGMDRLQQFCQVPSLDTMNKQDANAVENAKPEIAPSYVQQAPSKPDKAPLEDVDKAGVFGRGISTNLDLDDDDESLNKAIMLSKQSMEAKEESDFMTALKQIEEMEARESQKMPIRVGISFLIGAFFFFFFFFFFVINFFFFFSLFGFDNIGLP